MKGSLKVLDCTLRDGGQGLENINSNNIKTEYFTDSEKIQIAELVRDSGIDIIEIGSMSEAFPGLEKYAIYENVEDLSKFLPRDRGSNQIFTGLYIDPDTNPDKIPEHSPELVDGIRVILRYSQLKQSVDFCYSLAKKGYKVFIQPMLTMRYTDKELENLIYAANEMGAYALYFVDSFGYMNEKDVDRLYRFYNEDLSKNVRIGFHAHNNMDSAFMNAKYFIDRFDDHDRIVDSCAVGMGQGAGNLQTEVLVHYLNSTYATSYDINKVLDVCEILDKFRKHDLEGWGYSTLRFIPAMHGAAYKYAQAMRLEYNMSLSEINQALTGISDELRHRYTKENLKQLLKL